MVLSAFNLDGVYRACVADFGTCATIWRYGRKGTLTAGVDAEMTVLNVDPAADVTTSARVHMTIREGRIVWRSSEAMH